MVWLYVTAIATAIIAIAGWLINKEAPLWLKGAIVLLVVVVLTAQIFVVRAAVKEKEASRYSGVLQGKPITVLSANQEVCPKLKLGNSKTFLNWQGPQGEPMLKIFEDNDLTIWIDDDRLRLSTKIRNKTGEMIAELIGNEWKVKPEKLWDRNYNDSALEVIDETGDVVLQVILKEDYVQFAAKMYSSSGQGFAIGSAEFTEEDLLKHEQGQMKIVAAKDGPKEVKVGDITGVLEKRPLGEPLELLIEPIFKYPSELHFGELRENR